MKVPNLKHPISNKPQFPRLETSPVGSFEIEALRPSGPAYVAAPHLELVSDLEFVIWDFGRYALCASLFAIPDWR